jgi:hypothetical protein
MDTDLPIRNLSGETKLVGSTIRHKERTNDGRFAKKGSALVRPLPQPSGPGGGYDSVTGRWIPGAENRAVLRTNEPLDFERVDRVSPDYSTFAAISTQLDSGQYHMRRKA